MLDRELIKKIRYIQVSTRKAVESFVQGAYKSYFKGHGLQFSDIREYQHGDDIRYIAWKLTAKTPDETFIKIFEEERSLNVSILVDVSASNLFGLGVKKKVDLIAELTSLISFSALKTNDSVSMLNFNDAVLSYIPHKKGRKHVMRIITEVFKKDIKKGKTNLAKTLAEANNLLKKRGIVFIISDFISEEDYTKELLLLNRRHDVVALWVYDDAEKNFPNLGLLSVEDPETASRTLIDFSSLEFKTKHQMNFDKYINKTKKSFLSSGTEFLQISTTDNYAKMLEIFFKKRGRRYAGV